MATESGRLELAFVGGAVSAAFSLWCCRKALLDYVEQELHERKIRRMPSRIILVRHGQSEANVDADIWNKKPDNMIELTEKGCEQARRAGHEIRRLIGDQKAVAVVSPFWRANMTMRNIHKMLPGQVIETRIEPRVREQEFGNVQTAETMREYRHIRNEVGRFWFRFPEGESGADVYSRVAACLQSLKALNTRKHHEPVDTVIVVTHGLTMRLMLCAEMSWSPDTFHTIRNPANCELWVLQRSSTGRYEIDVNAGGRPLATRDVHVHYHDGRIETRTVPDYLSIPQPRTLYPDLALERLGIDRAQVKYVDYWCGQYKRRD